MPPGVVAREVRHVGRRQCTHVRLARRLQATVVTSDLCCLALILVTFFRRHVPSSAHTVKASCNLRGSYA